MKNVLLFGLFICIITFASAQEKTYKLSICDFQNEQITIKELNNILHGECLNIQVSDNEGKSVQLIDYTFIISPIWDGFSTRDSMQTLYGEQVIGNRITKGIKQRLTTVKPGDLLVFHINIKENSNLLNKSYYIEVVKE